MNNNFQDFLDSPAGAFGVQAVSTLGIGMFGMAMSLPDLSFQNSGTVPVSGAAEGVGAAGGIGAFGGGGLPTNTAIQTLALSLALIPLGLLAVAVFPPFARFVD